MIMKHFTLIQKLAILKSLDAVMMADGKASPEEKVFLEKVLKEMELQPFMVDEARKVSVDDSLEILKRMSQEKKQLFAGMMNDMIHADRKIDEREVNLLINLYREAQIDIEEQEYDPLERDLTMIFLESSRMNVYEEGVEGSRKSYPRQHDVRIELQPFEKEIYRLYISEKGMGLTFWGSDIVEPPLTLQLQEQREDRVVFMNTKEGIEVKVSYEGPLVRSILLQEGDSNRYREYLP